MRALSVLILLSMPAWHASAAETTIRPALIYSTPFGGTGSDYGTAVASDAAGNVYIAGNTTSADFPVKNGVQSRMGGSPLRASTDGGNTWAGIAVPAAVYSIAGSATTPGVLYAGTSAAIYKSADSGKTWTSLSTAPRALVNALIVNSVNPAVVYAGTSLGVFKSQDAGATWLEIDQKAWSVIALVASPARPSTLFAGIDPSFAYDSAGRYGPTGPSLYVSTNAGITWTPSAGLPDAVIALACDPSNPDVLYATANPLGFSAYTDPADTSIYKSVDAGSTWKKLLDSPVATSTFALAASATSVYAATVNGVLRSRDGGATWAATPITTAADNVAVAPGNPQVVYASAGGIFMSGDGGTTWKSSLPVRQNVQTLTVLPGTPGPVFVGATPGQNIFVTKWSGDGKQTIYSTYLGGSYYDFATGITVDRQGNAYVAGYTYATDFPVTRGALQSKTTAVYTGFLAKIAPDGGSLVYSTYLGGSSGDAAFAIAVDAGGNAYLTGYAGSADFPVTTGALQPRIKDKCAAKDTSPVGDAFVTKVNTDGSSLLYSTFLGGSCADEGTSIAVDDLGRAAIVGVTVSDDFPVTRGAFQEKLPGTESGFAARLGPQGNALLQASFVGGPRPTTADAVTVDSKGAFYITGCTQGFDDDSFGADGTPTIVFDGGGAGLPQAAFSTYCSGAAYVMKLDPTASSKVYRNYMGGTKGEGYSIAVDQAGRAWISGYAFPINLYSPTPAVFPAVHPFQIGTGQGFVSEWSADGATLLFSSQMNSAYAMAMDGSGNVFLTGFANPPEKYHPAAFVARIDGSVSSAVTVEEPQRITPDWAYPTMQELGVAPGEIIVLTGSGLGPAQTAGAQIATDGRVSTTLAGSSVTFDGVPAPMLSAQANQIACIAPFAVAHSSDGTTTMQVQSNGANSNSIRMPVASTSVEALAIVNQDGAANTLDHPAAPGSIVTIYAAGFGETDPPSLDGEVNGTAVRRLKAGSVRVGIDGGSDAQILYAGPAPGQVAGIVQINLRVPLDPGQYIADLGFAADSTSSDYQSFDLSVGQSGTSLRLVHPSAAQTLPRR